MKKQLNNTLNEEQKKAVKESIVESMKSVYTNAGALPGNGFDEASGLIADSIIKNSQKLLSAKVVSKKNARK